MAQLAYTITTAGTTLNKIWRKVQTKLYHGFKTQCEEWSWLDDLPNFEVAASAREILVPLDLNEAYGTAMIPEGGSEANPVTPNVEEALIDWTNYSQRWTTTITARFLSQRGQDASLINHFKYQGIKAVEALSRNFGYDFYGFSTGILAENQTNDTQTTDVITIANAFGVSGLGDADYLNGLFQVGDRIALIDAGSLVTNAIGSVDDKSAATLTVTYNGSVDQDVGDDIVKANSVENTTIAGTNYNLAPTGLLDITTSASLYGLTHDNWVAAVEDSSGGRFGLLKLRQLKQGIMNRGGGKLTDIIWTNGIDNDVTSAQSGSLRFSDSFAMEIDGEAKAKGVRFRTSPKVPTGCLFGFDRKHVRKFNINDKPGEGGVHWDDGHKIPDKNAYVFGMDWAMGMVCTSRLNTGVFTGLTES